MLVYWKFLSYVVMNWVKIYNIVFSSLKRLINLKSEREEIIIRFISINFIAFKVEITNEVVIQSPFLHNQKVHAKHNLAQKLINGDFLLNEGHNWITSSAIWFKHHMHHQNQWANFNQGQAKFKGYFLIQWAGIFLFKFWAYCSNS